MKLLILSRVTTMETNRDGQFKSEDISDLNSHNSPTHIELYSRDITNSIGRENCVSIKCNVNQRDLKHHGLVTRGCNGSLVSSCVRHVRPTQNCVYPKPRSTVAVADTMYHNTPCVQKPPIRGFADSTPLDLSCVKPLDRDCYGGTGKGRHSDSPLDLSVKTRRTVADSTHSNGTCTITSGDVSRNEHIIQQTSTFIHPGHNVNINRTRSEPDTFNYRKVSPCVLPSKNGNHCFLSDDPKPESRRCDTENNGQWSHNFSPYTNIETSSLNMSHVAQSSNINSVNGDQHGITAHSDKFMQRREFANGRRMLPQDKTFDEGHVLRVSQYSLPSSSLSLPNSPHPGSTSPYMVPNSPRGTIHSHSSSPGLSVQRSLMHEFDHKRDVQCHNRNSINGINLSNSQKHKNKEFTQNVNPIVESKSMFTHDTRHSTTNIASYTSQSNYRRVSVAQNHDENLFHSYKMDPDDQCSLVERDKPESNFPESDSPPTLSLVSPEIKHVGSTPPSPIPSMPVLSPYNKTPPGKPWFPPAAPPPLVSVLNKQRVIFNASGDQHRQTLSNQQDSVQMHKINVKKDSSIWSNHKLYDQNNFDSLNGTDMGKPGVKFKEPGLCFQQNNSNSQSNQDGMPYDIQKNSFERKCQSSFVSVSESKRYPDTPRNSDRASLYLENCEHNVTTDVVKKNVHESPKAQLHKANGLIREHSVFFPQFNQRHLEANPSSARSSEEITNDSSVRHKISHGLGASGSNSYGMRSCRNDDTSNEDTGKTINDLCLPFLIYGEVVLSKSVSVNSDSQSKTPLLESVLTANNRNVPVKRQEWDNSVIDLTDNDSPPLDNGVVCNTRELTGLATDCLKSTITPLAPTSQHQDQITESPLKELLLEQSCTPGISNSNKTRLHEPSRNETVVSRCYQSRKEGNVMCISDINGDCHDSATVKTTSDNSHDSPSCPPIGINDNLEIENTSNALDHNCDVPKSISAKGHSASNRLSVKCSSEYKKLCPLMKKVSLTLEKEMQRRNSGKPSSLQTKSKLIKSKIINTDHTPIHSPQSTSLSRACLETNGDEFDFCGSENECSPYGDARFHSVKRKALAKRQFTDCTNSYTSPHLHDPKNRRNCASQPENKRDAAQNSCQKPPDLQKDNSDVNQNDEPKRKRKYLTKKTILKCRLNQLDDGLTPPERLDSRRPRKRYHKNKAYEEELLREERRKALLRAKRKQRQQFEGSLDGDPAKCTEQTIARSDSVNATYPSVTPKTGVFGVDRKRLGRPPKKDNISVGLGNKTRRPIGRPKNSKSQTVYLKSRAKYTRKLPHSKVSRSTRGVDVKLWKRESDVVDSSDYLPDLLQSSDSITQEGVSEDLLHLPERIKDECKYDSDFTDDGTIIYDPNDSEETDGVDDKGENMPPSESAITNLSIPPDLKRLQVNKNLGETVLHRAARLGYEDVIVYCIESELIDINVRDHGGYTPLHESCVRGNLQVAKRLIACGANVNSSAQDGTRPIHDAIACNRIELVRLLLSSGADPTLATYSGRTCRKIAHTKEMKDFLQGYELDLNGASDSCDIPWEFHGSSLFGTDDSAGFDLFGDAPSDDDIAGHEPFIDNSDKQHLLAYSLQLESDKGPCNYHLLKDVLAAMRMDRDEFFNLCGNVSNVTVTCDVFQRHVQESQLTTQSFLNWTVIHSNSETKPVEYVELVRLDDNLRHHLCISSLSLRGDVTSTGMVCDSGPDELSPLHHEQSFSSYCEYLDRSELETVLNFDHQETNDEFMDDELENIPRKTSSYPTQYESNPLPIMSLLDNNTQSHSPADCIANGNVQNGIKASNQTKATRGRHRTALVASRKHATIVKVV